MNAVMQEAVKLPAPSVELLSEIQQTLYREARLLDAERYDDWVTMLTEDLHYHMPGIETRYRRDKTHQVGDLKRMAYYNDRLDDLNKRLRRLKTDYIDLYQHHQPDADTPIDETFRAPIDAWFLGVSAAEGARRCDHVELLRSVLSTLATLLYFRRKRWL